MANNTTAHVHLTTADLHGKSRGFIPQGKRSVMQEYIPGTQPGVNQYVDNVSGAKVFVMDSHGEIWDASVVSALQSTYPGLMIG